MVAFLVLAASPPARVQLVQGAVVVAFLLLLVVVLVFLVVVVVLVFLVLVPLALPLVAGVVRRL